MVVLTACSSFFFFNDTATTEIYTLSLHDALPILLEDREHGAELLGRERIHLADVPLFDDEERLVGGDREARSEEDTSGLQSRSDLVCRPLLAKKKRCWVVTALTPTHAPRATPRRS